ncbi:MAG TPA: phosphoribosylglycinamide formyltransferase [Clostridiales bacterium]|nr:phosphoribosylglycinamide formyltransferase [Clostridiales bacterium]
MLNLAIFVSGGGTNLQAIMDRIDSGSLKQVRIAGVIASRPGTYAEQRAIGANIPCIVVSRKDFPDIVSYDQTLLDYMDAWSVGLAVLAGFLSLLGPDFIAAYRNRIINIHPALIPAFCGPGFYGIRPHEAALEYGVKISGATVHFVDEHYDQGPIILQKAVAVKPDDTPQSLQLRIMQEAEQVILPEAIALFAAGRIRICGRKTIIADEEQEGLI